MSEAQRNVGDHAGESASSNESQEGARLLALGDAALTVEFGSRIDATLNERVIAYAEAVRAAAWPGILDVVPTYRSVTIHVDPLRLDLDTLGDRVRRLLLLNGTTSPRAGTRHTIPVLYGGEWGPDLADVAAFAKLSVEETIRLHAATVYRVYMLGFTPGFPYLGTVPEPLAMPRLATPRASVPAGSVGIAGKQTGIYPSATPGGWRLIGRTPVALIRRTGDVPFLLAPGDEVRFEPIDREAFHRWRGHDDVGAD